MRPRPSRMRAKQKPGIVIFLAAAMALAGCGEKFRREKQIETEVVSESSTSGVTSTIVAPGEAAPPLAGTAPLTGTNADTTTAFTILDSNVPPSSTAGPGTLAGTLALPGSNEPASRPESSPPPARESVISIQRSTPAPTTSQEPAAAEPVPAVSSQSTTPTETAPAQPAAKSEPAEEESDSTEPAPSPTPPASTSTSTATNPD